MGTATAATTTRRPLAGQVAGRASFHLRSQPHGVRWKEVICLWRVLGWQVPVKAVVAEVVGYKKRFLLVSYGVGLSWLQLVLWFASSFIQEDGLLDLIQSMCWEECRAWTKNPIERTTQATFVTSYRACCVLLEFRRLAAAGSDGLVDSSDTPSLQGQRAFL